MDRLQGLRRIWQEKGGRKTLTRAHRLAYMVHDNNFNLPAVNNL